MGIKKDFEVTEKAGEWVAGVRSPGAGKTLPLTDEQAHHALVAGELMPVKPKDTKKAASAETVKTVEA